LSKKLHAGRFRGRRHLQDVKDQGVPVVDGKVAVIVVPAKPFSHHIVTTLGPEKLHIESDVQRTIGTRMPSVAHTLVVLVPNLEALPVSTARPIYFRFVHVFVEEVFPTITDVAGEASLEARIALVINTAVEQKTGGGSRAVVASCIDDFHVHAAVSTPVTPPSVIKIAKASVGRLALAPPARAFGTQGFGIFAIRLQQVGRYHPALQV
jgi:hypothetical protein